MVQQTTLKDFGPFVESLFYGAEHSAESPVKRELAELCTEAFAHPGRAQIESILGHTFKDKHLLIKALTHRSIVSEVKSFSLRSYERLEFLGDAILDLLVTERLMRDFDSLSEGELSKFRSTLVNEETLNEMATHFGLERFLILGRGERSSGGSQRASVRADIVESLLGAIYLDEGHADFNYMRGIFEQLISRFETPERKYFDLSRLDNFDPKTTLQERTMRALNILPEYVATEIENGFNVSINLMGRPLASANETSKRRASKEAAKEALAIVDQIINEIKSTQSEL